MELVVDPAEEIIRLHLECMLSVKTSLKMAIDIGEKLAIQKENLDHGEFTPWIEENLPFTVRTAQNYLKLFIKKEQLLEANIDDISGAYLLLAPKEDQSDIHIHKNPTKNNNEDEDVTPDIAAPEEHQDSFYSYWDHLSPLITKMYQVAGRLIDMRDHTTPKALGHLFGNIKEMADVLNSWDPSNMDICEECDGEGCEMCIAGKVGIYQESNF